MLEYQDPITWQPLEGLTLEPTALEVVKGKTNFSLIAGPGAGKTEMLAQKASFLLQTGLCVPPRKILALSYKKDAEKNIKDRVTQRVGKELSSRFTSLTYDAFAKRLLDHFLAALPGEYQPQPDYEIATSILEIFQEFYRGQISGFQRADLFDRFTREIRLLPFAGPLNEKIAETNVREHQLWARMLKGNDTHPTSKITFPLITVLAEFIIRANPLIRKALAITYSHVFLDEFQDTTKANYRLIRTCFVDSGCAVTAVGDDKQRIMRWAGAYEEVFAEFERDFRCARKSLTMNFRSAPRLITLQKLITQYMGKADLDIQPSPKWRTEDGVCEVHLFQHPDQEAEVTARNVASWLQGEGLQPHDICFIVRQRPVEYAETIIQALRVLNIEARNENDYQDLLSEEVTQLLLDLILISISKGAADAYRNCDDLLCLLRGVSSNLDIEEKHREIEEELFALRQLIGGSLSRTTSEELLEQALQQIIDQLGRSAIRLIFPQYRNDDYLRGLVEKLSHCLWSEFQVCQNWEKAVKRIYGENSIPVMTIHKSKGLEYHTVVFIGLEDRAFWNFAREKEEEVNAFFVAMSRAKERLIFTFTDQRNNRPNSRVPIQSLYNILRESGVVVERNYR